MSADRILDPAELKAAKDAEIVEDPKPEPVPVPPTPQEPVKQVTEEPPGLPVEPAESDKQDEPEEPAPPPTPRQVQVKAPVKPPEPRQIAIPETEYQVFSQTVASLTQMEEILKVNPNPDIQAQIGFTKANLWDGIAKRFGYANVESAQQSGVTFSLKTVRVIECKPVGS